MIMNIKMNKQLIALLFFLQLFALRGSTVEAANGAVSLVYPKYGQFFSDTSIAFEWNTYAGASSYNLEIATDSLFSAIVITKTGLAVTDDTINLAMGSDYFWRVQADTGTGSTSWSDKGKFTLFDPISIGSIEFWVSPTSGMVMDTGGYITTWKDKSGNGRDASQDTINKKPQLDSSFGEINNIPIVSWRGTGADAKQMDFEQIRLGNYTAYFMYKLFLSFRAVHYLMGGDTSGTAAKHSGFYAGGQACVGVPIECIYIGINDSNKVLLNATVEPTTWGVVTFTKSTIYRNGGIIGSTGTPLDGMLLSRLGDRVFDEAQGHYFYGEMAEVLIFSKELTGAEKTKTDNYFYDKYAPPMSLGKDISVPYGFCGDTLRARTYFVSKLWSDNSTGDSLVVNKTGTYWCEGTDIFGRVSRDTVEVSFTEYTNYKDSTICMGGNMTWYPAINDSTYSYLWNDLSTDSFLLISDTGNYYFTVTDSSGCSSNSDTLVIQLDSFELKVTLGSDTNLCSGNIIRPLDIGETFTSHLWSDGLTDTALSITATANYSVTVTNLVGCMGVDTTLVTIKGNAPAVSFIPTNVCIGDSSFFISLSTPVPPEKIISWDWDFGDGKTGSGDSIKHLYDSAKVYNGTLTVTTDSGCGNAGINNVTVYQLPNVDFMPSLACDNEPITFTDTATNDPGLITQWDWNFDDGNSGVDSISALPTPSHLFNNSGLYNVNLTLTTTNGCQDSTQKVVEVRASPTAAFAVSDTCLGDTTYFIDQSISGTAPIDQWDWDFDDGISSSDQNPWHVYTLSNSYNVELIATDTNGCADTTTQATKVIPYPVSDFDMVEPCAGFAFVLRDSSTISSDSIVSSVWNIESSTFFGDSLNYTINDTGALPGLFKYMDPHTWILIIRQNWVSHHCPLHSQIAQLAQVLIYGRLEMTALRRTLTQSIPMRQRELWTFS